ncbi:MAG: transcription termination/antitermination protein NusA, partial [Bacteroidales bacterium]|nr:transcription termination/antitermination protein NusA [Bacteroidales bacterium]
NVDRGDIEVWRNRIIVEDGKVEDPTKQIAYSEAIRIEPDFEIGEEASEQITSNEFNRREILTFLQNLKTKVLEFEKDNIYKKYKDNVGEIISGEVYQIYNKKIILLDDEGIELILPKSEQIPSDKFRKNDTIRAVVLKVDINKKNNNPEIILSRTSPVFLERLFESEVPEIFDGLITIKKVVRVPGERAKIAVESYDSRIDPVGACVGMKGSRIHSIVRELNNENIDVINYTTNTSLYITRSLSPAKITSITLDEENKKAQVFLKPDQVSLTIGKSGHNIKLASKLIGYDIDVYNDMEDDVDDVDLQEFADEIDQWIIDIFKEKGYDTAKSILALDFETLVKRTDLEEETIQEIINILKAEFE